MSKLRANFIVPSWNYWKEPLRAQPLTQLYLATILEEKGVDVEFTDYREQPTWAEPFLLKPADIYLYTVASPDFKELDATRSRIKKVYPESKHIAGGPHATIAPQDFEDFDSVVVGKGEESLKKILKDFPNLHTLYKTPIKKEEYPFPKRHFLSKDKIVNDNLFKTDNIRSTTAQFSFGCPFSCAFCANYDKGNIRRNSLQKIGSEIEYLKSEYGIEGLSLQDEICIPKFPNQLFGILKAQNIKWRGQVRADINEETIRLAKKSGLVELSFGLESVDEKVLKIVDKKIKVKDVENVIEYCKDNNVKTRVYLLNGLPGEGEDIVSKTISFIKKNNPDLILLSSFQPYPGSPIERAPEKYGIKWISTEYDKFNHIVCRFNDSKDNLENAVPYEFEKGKGLSRKQIIDNMLSLQYYLRERGMNK